MPTNPTQTELIDLITAAVISKTSSTGVLPDAEINESIGAVIEVYDNLDPDRPVKVRNLQRA